MFYTNNFYSTEAIRIINETDGLITTLSTNKERGKIESELKFTLVLKSTGNIELYFDDIMNAFAIKNSSIIFHKYFQNNFTKAGKNVNPEQVNNLLKCLGVSPVDKKINPQAYTSLESLYNIRNKIAHGDTCIVETYNDIKNYIEKSMDFMQLIINNLDVVSK